LKKSVCHCLVSVKLILLLLSVGIIYTGDIGHVEDIIFAGILLPLIVCCWCKFLFWISGENIYWSWFDRAKSIL